MAAQSIEQLEPFAPTSYKITHPPNPEWKLGDSVDSTPEGKEWMQGLESGWEVFDTSNTDPATLYRLLINGIVPRPVAFVSSVSEDGIDNLGLFSWFNQVTSDPPVISVSCSNTAKGLKDTARNIKTSKEFVVNIISEPWIHHANVCSIDAPPEVSEWPLTGLTKEKSIHVKAPRVKESAFSMECELLQAIDVIEPKSGRATGTLILGTVKYIHIRKDVMDVKGNVDPGKLRPVVRLAGITYASLGDGYKIPRLVWAENENDIKEAIGDAIYGDRKS